MFITSDERKLIAELITLSSFWYCIYHNSLCIIVRHFYTYGEISRFAVLCLPCLCFVATLPIYLRVVFTWATRREHTHLPHKKPLWDSSFLLSMARCWKDLAVANNAALLAGNSAGICVTAKYGAPKQVNHDVFATASNQFVALFGFPWNFYFASATAVLALEIYLMIEMNIVLMH